MFLFWLFAKVLAAICLLGLAGGFVAIHFSDRRRFVLLLAPACGLLTLPILVTLIYSTDRFSFLLSAVIALLLCSATTIFNVIRWRPSREDAYTSIALVILVAAAATCLFCASTISAGSPTILYIDGSDHGGYAQAADWLLSHTFSQQPIVSPEHPYQSWPAFIFTKDFRYSAFVALALTALLNQTSGLFAYDPACAVAFSVACLSIAAAFARSKTSIVGLSLCLLTTAWFELGRDGYFGKLLAFPSCLFLLGLFMTSSRKMTPQKLALLVALTVGVATMHSGMATGLLFAAIAGLFICVDVFFTIGERQFSPAERFIWLAAITLVAFASGGMFSRPVTVPGSPPGFFIDWATLLPRIFEIQNPTRNYLTISETWLYIGSAAAFLLHASLVAAAVLRRNAIAVALTAGPLLIFVAMILLDTAGSVSARFAAYQFTSILASFGFCGFARLVDDADADRVPVRSLSFIAATCAVLIIVRVPRTIGSLNTYVFDPPATQIFKKVDFDAIAAAAGKNPLLADLHDDLNVIAVLVELGRRGTNLQWSPVGWDLAVNFRKWIPPNYATEPALVLDDKRSTVDPARVIYETTQFRLVKPLL
jgi:hypothetical protein